LDTFIQPVQSTPNLLNLFSILNTFTNVPTLELGTHLARFATGSLKLVKTERVDKKIGTLQ
jgi:hypothetical protein